MEYLALDPAGPDADVVVHPLLAQHLRKAFGRCDQRVAAAIEPAQPGDAERFEEGEIIVAKIGFEARVDRAGDRNAPSPRPGRGLPRHAVGARDMEDVRRELADILAHPGREGQGNTIFAASRDRHRRQADEIAGSSEESRGGKGVDRTCKTWLAP